MSIKILMPKLGLTMTSGRVISWYKEEGDEVKKGETLFDLETEKITNEVTAEKDGILAVILVDEGEEVPVKETVAVIAEPGEDVQEVKNKHKNVEDETITEEDKAEETKEQGLTEVTREEKVGRINKNGQEILRVSPRARKLAEEREIDLEEVRKIARGERIISDDVNRFIEQQNEKDVKKQSRKKEKSPVTEKSLDEKEYQVMDLSQMRKSIADRLKGSWQVPHIYLRREVDATEILKLRQVLKEAAGESEETAPSLNSILARAVVHTLKKYPRLNGTMVDGEYRVYKKVNLGIAVALEEGLIVPVVKGACKLDLENLSDEIEAVVDKSREKKLELSEMEGGTFTISNLGMYGIDEFTAILNPPQIGILAVGAIKKKHEQIEKGEFVQKKVMQLTLGLDHRVLDGAVGALFLKKLTQFIENPALMI